MYTNTIRYSKKCANHLGTVSAPPPPPPPRGGRGVSPWDTPLYSAPMRRVKQKMQKNFYFQTIFLLTSVQVVKRKLSEKISEKSLHDSRPMLFFGHGKRLRYNLRRIRPARHDRAHARRNLRSERLVRPTRSRDGGSVARCSL